MQEREDAYNITRYITYHEWWHQDSCGVRAISMAIWRELDERKHLHCTYTWVSSFVLTFSKNKSNAFLIKNTSFSMALFVKIVIDMQVGFMYKLNYTSATWTQILLIGNSLLLCRLTFVQREATLTAWDTIWATQEHRLFQFKIHLHSCGSMVFIFCIRGKVSLSYE